MQGVPRAALRTRRRHCPAHPAWRSRLLPPRVTRLQRPLLALLPQPLKQPPDTRPLPVARPQGPMGCTARHATRLPPHHFCPLGHLCHATPAGWGVTRPVAAATCRCEGPLHSNRYRALWHTRVALAFNTAPRLSHTTTRTRRPRFARTGDSTPFSPVKQARK